MNLTENARTVLNKRYLKKDEAGRPVETPEIMFRRVARAVAEADRLYDPEAPVEETANAFYTMMASLEFLPNSPTLMNAGRKMGQLSACFVLPIEDSMESIFDALKYTAIIHKTGGGTGFSFSRLRPKNDIVLSTHGVSSGPVSFMGVFDAATEAIKQGGTRRGANMGILRVDHPDIEEFISCKRGDTRLNNFNISVAVTDRFMEAVGQNEDFPLVNPRTGEVVRYVKARLLFDQIVESAWQNGDPGLIFLDAINRCNPTPHLGDIESTNPCGEQPLLPYESCNLGSINLSRMVRKKSNGAATVWEIDHERLRNVVHKAVHFLDNVIDVNKYPIPPIKELTLKNRKIGLGVMGFADMLITLAVPYDSDEAAEVGRSVMKFIQAESKAASAELGRVRGNFPKVLDGQELIETHPEFERIARERGFYSESLMELISTLGSIRRLEGVPDDVKRLFPTAHDIPPEWHIKIQAAFQEHTDNAVSKTINFHGEASVEEVKEAYLQAYRSGCKGITIYRYGSRAEQVLNLRESRIEEAEAAVTTEVHPIIGPRARPVRTTGVTERIRTGCGNLYVTINSDDKGYCEVFAQVGKAGGCASSQTEMAGRLISLALRSGVDIKSVAKQLNGIRCPSPSWDNGKSVLSCSDAIGQIISKYTGAEVVNRDTTMGACPDCGGVVEHEGGCLVCRSCGFSRCA
ncbi:MAG: adenosylcobalamin-dependent ribonucleoside-diphosphate reductase [Deltaproteobacteria bacterium]|nr:adenosylcobalamin-dependent ribonucleoside-diphosphate reductase [Deltaproteobacteria bacterium]